MGYLDQVIPSRNCLVKVTECNFFCFTVCSVCGKEVVGIWSENWRETEINCADVAHVSSVIATGDDSGFVKLFKFPCSEKNVLN